MVYVTFRTILFPLFRAKFKEISGGEYLPKNGPYILAANHIDYLDGFYIAMAVHLERGHEVYFLTTSHHYWWTRATIPIDSQQRSQSIDDALAYLKVGKAICNFVEGARNNNKHLLKGKTGVARLALLGSVPIIPVGIRGPSAKNFAQSLTNLITEQRNIVLRFGPEIKLEQFWNKPLDHTVLSAATQEIMRSLVPLTGKVYVG